MNDIRAICPACLRGEMDPAEAPCSCGATMRRLRCPVTLADWVRMDAEGKGELRMMPRAVMPHAASEPGQDAIAGASVMGEDGRNGN